jgi:hypothetical protein
VSTELNGGGQLRPLPVQPRPKAGETVDSYIRRLAQANHLKPSYLRGYLTGPPDYLGRPRPARLAVLTGRSQALLERTLADLVSPDRIQRVERPAPTRIVTRSADKPALFAAIRRDALEENLSIRKLADRHHVHRRTIVQALASPTPPPRKPRTVRDRPALDPIRSAIDAMLDEYDALQADQPPTARLIWERLLDEHDATVCYATVQGYLARRRPRPGAAVRVSLRTSGNILSTSSTALQGAVMRHYRDLLASVRQRPSMHGLDGSCAAVTAYVLGCDAGSSGGILTGFREWLIVRLGSGSNLAWPALIRHLTPQDRTHPLTPDADAAAVTTLFQLLDEFMEQREQPDSLFKIYTAYQAWLNTQSWYHLETPEPDQAS